MAFFFRYFGRFIKLINKIPPLIGFFSKQFVLYSAIQGGYFFISIIAILVSVISASYYLKIIKVLHEINTLQSGPNSPVLENTSIYKLRQGLLEKYSNRRETVHVNYFKEIQLIFILIFNLKSQYKNVLNPFFYNLSNYHSFLISNLTLIILLFVLKPSILLSSIRLLSLSIFIY